MRHVAPLLNATDTDPAWLRTAFVDEQERVFLPARLISQDEGSVMLRVESDGVAFVDAGHAYVLVTWACSVFPDREDFLEEIEATVLRVHRRKKILKNKLDALKYCIQ